MIREQWTCGNFVLLENLTASASFRILCHLDMLGQRCVKAVEDGARGFRRRAVIISRVGVHIWLNS